MISYLHLVQKEVPAIQEEDLYKPINETEIDSFDNLAIRVNLEKHFKQIIPDSKWYNFKTLAEALDFFVNLNGNRNAEIRTGKAVTSVRSIEIGMPQMANGALSENWLLKELGDVHWSLISKCLNKKSSELKDISGKRVYTTFVRIKYSLPFLGSFNENRKISFKSKISGYGDQTYLSEIKGNCGNDEISAQLMSVFSVRTGNSNEIIRGIPFGTTTNIKKLDIEPDFLKEYRLLKQNQINEHTTPFGMVEDCKAVLHQCEYEINPYYEINGVGLLYFAAYPIITDYCSIKFFKEELKIDFESNYQTTFRDIYYYSNCNRGDKILFQINNFTVKENKLITLISLKRLSDQKLLSKIITVKKQVV